jgi:ketosteroid isomerase-like protein
MSKEHVEIVRAHIEAFRAKDTERSASLMDDHVVRDWTRIGMLQPTAYGIEEVVKGSLDHRGAFEDYDYVVQELTDLGCGQVLAEVGETGRGKGSGAPVARSFAVLYTVLGGKIARITAFSDVQEAREAIGILD